MLQQQINNAQLAAVQQVKATLAASRQSSPSSSSSTQTTSTTSASTTSGTSSAPSSSRPVNASTTSTISQSVLFSGAAGGQGQMYLRVNRSLRSPISPQLIFMPSSTATAAVATVTQQPQQQHQEVNASGGAQDHEQAQNLAIRSAPTPKAVGVKTEAPDRGDSAPFSLVQPSHQSTTQSPSKPVQSHIKIPTYPKAQTSSSTSSIPLSQLLLHGPRTPAGAHILVQTSSSQTHGYTATIKPAVNAQTLVVQPLQKSALGAHKTGDGPHLLSAQLASRQPLHKSTLSAEKPVPIQPKTLQGLRLPLTLPSRNPPPILPAPPTSTSSSHQTPHIPVQIVGARPSSQALALARSSCSQEGAVLSSSSSLLTMVASLASRESGVVGRLEGRGVGLKTLQSVKEAAPLAQVSQKSSASPASRLSAATDEKRTVTNGDTARSHNTQGKQLVNSLKRKSESISTHEDGPTPPRLQPIRDQGSTQLTNQTETDTSPLPPPRPPSVVPLLSVSRGGVQSERGPPPQAVVKPSVLTHLIEGFVIQEGAEPFPVCGPIKDAAGEELVSESIENDQSETATPVLKCEYCKNFAPESQFRGTKRFCSMSCAKRYNVSFRQGNRQNQNQARSKDRDRNLREEKVLSEEEGRTVRRRVPRRTSSEIASAKIAGRAAQDKCGSESSRSEEESSADEEEDDAMTPSPASSTSSHQVPPLPTAQALPPQPQVPPPAQTPPSTAPTCPTSSPTQWSVQQVSQFISSLQGCEDLACQFLSQEIDGQALLLLKEEHLMSTMNMKLGPALKICAHINSLKD
uniref:Polyhomeotic-like protein 1 n=1 Tax=Knipowitschia caucasica TaxID=637954 RepID=A0AAV2K3S1_KNICA